MLNSDKFTNKKGLNLAEMIISTAVFAVLMLGAANFSSQFFNASAVSVKQLENVNQTRSIGESIAKEVSGASYIYPAGVSVSLSAYDAVTGTNSSFDINTEDSIALLFTGDSGGDGTYGLVAYFLRPDGNGTSLYQFVQAPFYDWEVNTIPAEELLNFNGNISKLVSDVDTEKTDLRYVLNYTNGVTDKDLQGQLGGVGPNDTNALIRGIEWEISQSNIENQLIKVKGLSRNVPRFIE